MVFEISTLAIRSEFIAKHSNLKTNYINFETVKERDKVGDCYFLSHGIHNQLYPMS